MADDRDAAMRAAARRLLPLLDLTSLNDDDTPDSIAALCRKAITPFGAVAAVCIYPNFVGQAKELLRGSGVRVATVANFPHGQAAPEMVAEEITAAIAAGADEVDVVIHLFEPRTAAPAIQEAAREASTGKTLKVILETGLIGDKIAIMKAAATAILGGADFIKTSSGKIAAGATPEAATAMLEAIRRFGQGRRVGFKASGGIRAVTQAWTYVDLAERIIGRTFVRPETFRFGASALLDDILAILCDGKVQSPSSSY